MKRRNFTVLLILFVFMFATLWIMEEMLQADVGILATVATLFALSWVATLCVLPMLRINNGDDL